MDRAVSEMRDLMSLFEHSTSSNETHLFGQRIQKMVDLDPQRHQSTIVFRGSVILEAGNLAFKQSRYEVASSYLHRAFDDLNSVNEILGQIKALMLLSFIARERGELDVHRTYLLDAMSINKRNGTVHQREPLLMALAGYHYYKGELSETMRLLEEIKSVYDNQEIIDIDVAQMANLYANLNIVYNELGAFRKALGAAKQAHGYADTLSIKGIQLQHCNSQARSYFFLNDIPNAKRLLKHVIAQYDVIKEPRSYMYALYNMGLVEMHQGNMERAMSYATAALDIINETGMAETDYNVLTLIVNCTNTNHGLISPRKVTLRHWSLLVKVLALCRSMSGIAGRFVP